jgi:hypothetical protein
MIPKNTKIVTKEMIRQLEIEQTEVLKELQRHYSRVNMIKHQFARPYFKSLTVKNNINLKNILHFHNLCR